MKKHSIIAHCLVNSNMISRLEDAEHGVQREFEYFFPQADFDAWNIDVRDDEANRPRGLPRSKRPRFRRIKSSSILPSELYLVQRGEHEFVVGRLQQQKDAQGATRYQFMSGNHVDGVRPFSLDANDIGNVIAVVEG